jgi:putative glycosyltransferase (TIGR04372 family)
MSAQKESTKDPLGLRLSRVAQFGLTQARKTIKQPSRLIRIPARYFLHAVMARPMNVGSKFGTALSDEADRDWRIRSHFKHANDLLQEDFPELAWKSYVACLRESRDELHYFVSAVCLIQGLGRFAEGCAVLARDNVLRAGTIGRLGLAAWNRPVLNGFWVAHIGHAATIDYVVKLGILQGKSCQDIILYIPPGAAVCNRFFIEQWRPHVHMIERPEDLPFGEDALKVLEWSYLGPRDSLGSTVYFWELAAKTYRRWYAEPRPPLFALPPQIEERGKKLLESKGVPRDAWIVGLHVREAGSKWHHNRLHRVLNANIADYVPAIEEITRRGGWVLRMGDKSMVPLPPMPNVIDYCHSDFHSDWMDVFICARSRFFVGTSSGPAYVPPLYGVPSVLTNWWPPAQRPWHPTDIFVPKMLRSKADERILPLSRTLAEPFCFTHSLRYLREVHGVEVQDNEPMTIRDAVLEMMDQIEGRRELSDRQIRQTQSYEQIYDSNRAFGLARLASVVLDKHPDFVN